MARFQSVRQFAPLMTQQVKIAAVCSTGYDDYGNAQFGADVTYQCAVVGEMKMVTNDRGQEVPSQHTVYLMGNPAVRPEARITLSTDDVGSTESYAINPDIVAIGRYPFLRGQYCTVVYLGRARSA